jgi:hypothetical protein
VHHSGLVPPHTLFRTKTRNSPVVVSFALTGDERQACFRTHGGVIQALLHQPQKNKHDLLFHLYFLTQKNSVFSSFANNTVDCFSVPLQIALWAILDWPSL